MAANRNTESSFRVLVPKSGLDPSRNILCNGEYYRDLGSDYYTKRTPERAIRRKIKDLEAARI